jgi:endonuclease YncB( thermonuclease family)
MVADGLAFAYRKYSMAYDLDEKVAANNDRGLHAHRIQSPSQFHKSNTKGRGCVNTCIYAILNE